MATQSTKRAGSRRNGRAPGKWRSWETTEGAIRAPHRSMMRAMGMSDADIDAPFVGVASTHNEVTPCNSGIKPLVDEIKVGVRASGGSPFEFGTITVSDAISMGTEGMRGSLISFPATGKAKTFRSRRSSKQLVRYRPGRWTKTSFTASKPTRARARARAAACSPQTRCRPSARRSVCQSPERRRNRTSISANGHRRAKPVPPS